MPTCLDAARLVMSKGMRPVPLMAGTKRPILENWPSYVAEPWTLEKDFTDDKNIGVILGEFADIDLDSPEAIALAPVFLPPTLLKHGRGRAPLSHWWYKLDARDWPKTVQFRDEKGMLVEFRCSGGQTMIPWSRHPDTNEIVEWAVPEPGVLPDPALVKPEVLLDAVAELATACVIARHWPAESRHFAALALSGVLGRAGWPEARVKRFIDAVCRAAGDEEAKDRTRAGSDTVANQGKGKRTTGIPTLVKYLGQGTVDRLLEWLRIDVSKPTAEPESPKDTLAGADAAIRAGEDPRIILRGVCQRILAGEVAEGIAKPMLAAASGRPEFEEMWTTAMEEARLLPVVPVLSHKDPQKTARAFLKAFHTDNEGIRLLHRHRGEFWRWRDGAYHTVPEEAIHSDLATFMEQGRCNPTRGRLADAAHLMLCEGFIEDKLEPPCWLGTPPTGYPDPAHLIAFQSGLLAPMTGEVYPPTPLLFNQSALPFDYDATATGRPSEWLAFLDSIWREDPESISVLQEIFGYLLTPDTSMQKMFLILGPRRSGKGTIARVLRRLLGEVNCAGPSMSSLASNFGCSSLIGKTCAIIADARTSSKTDQGAICDRLLSISGEDAIDIDRKNRPILTTQLKTRIVIMTNELPRIADASSALSGRFIILRMERSFFGEEDPGLLSRILPEMPQILHWALEGHRRLAERGYFASPASAKQVEQEMERQSSPIGAFISDRCIIDPEGSIYADRLYALYEGWCKENGILLPLTLPMLGRDLRTIIPKMEDKRVRRGAQTVRVYLGLREGSNEDELPD